VGHETSALLIALSFLGTTAAVQEGKPVPVTVENFVRAESNLAFAKVVEGDGFGKFNHGRELSPLDKQLVARQNRDTLYSTAVFDLNAGDVTITLSDAGKRFMTLITIDVDHYIIEVVYGAGRHTYTREKAGTRYRFEEPVGYPYIPRRTQPTNRSMGTLTRVTACGSTGDQ
jgi:Protein of unknown function (DUF1254)